MPYRVLFASFLLFLIFPLWGSAATNPGKHSSELRQVVSIDGSIERIDYFDQNGNLTFASDKHYATVIKTKNSSSVLEEYFDEACAPAKQNSGHYALLREYDALDRNFKTTYLGIDKQPIMNNAGYSAIVRDYYDDGTVKYERYYDAEGKPAKRSTGIYGRYNKYENGRNTVIIYLDENDHPVKNKSGYAILKRTYYEEGKNKGKVEAEFYFDEKEIPIALSAGQYGQHREYDELGRINIITYLDADGKPMVTNRGYTTIKRTFYRDNTVDTTMYYDINGKPAALSRGQYGIKRVNGKNVYLDIDGNEMFDLNNYLHTHHLSVILIAVVVVIISAACGKKVNVCLLLLYLAFIFYMTLMYRPEGDARAELELFWSYKQFFSSASLRLEILNNIWLFLPLGAMLFRFYPRMTILLIPVLLSVLIEACQYMTGYGLCELDDVISNSIGALTGFGVGYGLKRLKSAVLIKADPKENRNSPACRER